MDFSVIFFVLFCGTTQVFVGGILKTWKCFYQNNRDSKPGTPEW